MTRRESLVRTAALLAFAGAPATASAQPSTYPTRPVKLVIHYPTRRRLRVQHLGRRRVPKGTSKDIVATLRDQGAVPAGTTAEQFRQFVHDEVAKSDRIVSQAGIQPE